MARKVTTDDFISRARVVHGATYDYGLSVYTKARTPVKIICALHGVFVQTPHTHLKGANCQVCARTGINSISPEEFLRRAKEAHGDKYDYSETIYLTQPNKITIICPTHGAFKQLATCHMQGAGCKPCSLTKIPDTAAFIQKAQHRHGEKYNYSNTLFVSRSECISIICGIHGAFLQLPFAHLYGAGCQSCARDKVASHHRLTLSEFIDRAKAVHGDKYDYTNTIYKAEPQKLSIECPAHGPFHQTASLHLQGMEGCKRCSNIVKSKSWIQRAKNKNAILYFIRIFNNEESFYKIGITFLSIERRFKNFNTYKYEVLATHKSSNVERVYEWEQSILDTFRHLSYKPKCHFVGATECFSSEEEILECFPL